MSPTRQVTVAELQRAWRAVQAGDFLPNAPYAAHPAPGASLPSLGGWVIPVLGCAGGVGASTTALALATATDAPCRLIEAAPASASGLAGASTAELGVHGAWQRGRRGPVLIDRTTQTATTVTDIPAPAPADEHREDSEDRGDGGGGGEVTLVDVAWPVEAMLARPSWLRETLTAAETVVLVAAATTPGLRRLEAVLTLLPTDQVNGGLVAAVVGPRLARWPGPLRHSTGPRTEDLLDAGRVVALPHDRHLAITGVDTTPLPAALVAAAGRVLDLLPAPTSSSHVMKGPTP